MKNPKKYKTGDVVTLRKGWDGLVYLYRGYEWVIACPYGIAHPYQLRSEAREEKESGRGERIARVIKETPKTVTVVISK